MPTNTDFANNCSDLLASAGPCVVKRMFGGFAISTDGLTIAILADLGDGEQLWLKGDDNTRSKYEAAGCKIFTHQVKSVPRSMNYFSSPDEAMDSPDAMRPWAALALNCALRARAGRSLFKANEMAKAVVKTAVKQPAKKQGIEFKNSSQRNVITEIKLYSASCPRITALIQHNSYPFDMRLQLRVFERCKN